MMLSSGFWMWQMFDCMRSLRVLRCEAMLLVGTIESWVVQGGRVAMVVGAKSREEGKLGNGAMRRRTSEGDRQSEK